MYVTADTIIKAASLLSAFGALGAAIGAIFRVIETNKRQSVQIKEIQEEQYVICCGVKGALEGLIEQGCDGTCKKALDMLNEHLLKKSHDSDL